MTFSIVARCAETGMFGVAVASSSPAVAARCVYARAGVGAVASQNITDPTLGPKTLDLMERGALAAEAVEIIARTAPHIEYRQVTAVDVYGSTGIHSGRNVLGTAGHFSGRKIICAGNLLANKDVLEAMFNGFRSSSGHLGDQLIAAMRAAIAAGGEAGPVHSAGMKLVDKVSWPVADLRVDWTEDCPVEQLAKLWGIYRPQLDAYVARALDPATAPSFGVPGDE